MQKKNEQAVRCVEASVTHICVAAMQPASYLRHLQVLCYACVSYCHSFLPSCLLQGKKVSLSAVLDAPNPEGDLLDFTVGGVSG